VIVKKATSKGKKRQLLTPTTFSLIHCTDFADRYERQILPLLKAGYLVLCDRYVYTAFARDAVRGCSRPWLRNLYGFARRPDLTFFFNTPLPIALGRILSAGRSSNIMRPGWTWVGSRSIPELPAVPGADLPGVPGHAGRIRFRDDRWCRHHRGAAALVRKIVGDAVDLPSYRWKIGT